MKKLINYFKMGPEEKRVTFHFFMGFTPLAVFTADMMVPSHNSILAIICGIILVGGSAGLLSIFVPPILEYLHDCIIS